MQSLSVLLSLAVWLIAQIHSKLGRDLPAYVRAERKGTNVLIISQPTFFELPLFIWRWG